MSRKRHHAVQAIRRHRVTIVVLLAVLIAATPSLHHTIEGLSLVVRAADLRGVPRWAANLTTGDVAEWSVQIPALGEALPARVYAPRGRPRFAVLLITGVHPAGIREPRLVRLSRELAKAHVTVVTPEISELVRFAVTPVVTDRIERAAVWLATESRMSDDGRIGLIGVSFSGGLAIVAAGRPSLRDRLSFVLSVGGHDDLGRVIDSWCSAGARRPHDYGVAIALSNLADRLVPDEQRGPLREALVRFLNASYVDRIDRRAAARELDALSATARWLPEPSRTLISYVIARDVGQLAPVLAPHLRPYAAQAALSPARSPLPRAPVYLLHGRDDAVIPSSESRYLSERLRGRAPVYLLITRVISHADADQPAHVTDVTQLARFWGRLLAERTTMWRRRPGRGHRALPAASPAVALTPRLPPVSDLRVPVTEPGGVMPEQPDDTPILPPPLGQLERALIDEFVRQRGYDPDRLAALPADEREALLKQASLHASSRMAEVESRSHYIDEVRHGHPPLAKTGLE
jgi:dienelactone hydrolase